MKIVIDIPEEIYEHVKDRTEDSNDEWITMRAVANGISLPKGHGKLIDSNILKGHIDKLPCLPDGNFAGNHSALKALINMQPSIIEADGGEG